MEDIKKATYYAQKIVEEDRHKFVYSYNDNRSLLIEKIKELYPITIGDKPGAFCFEMEGLPRIKSNMKYLDKNVIAIISDEYVDFFVASQLISSIISNNDMDKIKNVEQILLNYINRATSKNNVSNINQLLQLLKETKDIYLEAYCDYLQKGVLENPMDKAPLKFIELCDFIDYTREMLNKHNHISLILNHNKEVSLETYRAVNNLVGSRINASLSVNILTEKDSWESYMSQNGQLIESCHDYENVYYDKNSTDYLVKIKR